MKRLIVLSVFALGACAASQEVWGGRTPAREAQAVQGAAVRYLAEHYDPSDFLGKPEAICLVVGQRAGRRDRIATAIAARSEDMDPPAYLGLPVGRRPIGSARGVGGSRDRDRDQSPAVGDAESRARDCNHPGEQPHLVQLSLFGRARARGLDDSRLPLTQRRWTSSTAG